MYRFLILVGLLSLSSGLHAQYDHEHVFPDLNGEALLEAVQSSYTTPSVLSFSNARDTLFSKVWTIDDSLACVYTGFKRYIDPNEDPTTTVFNDGTPDGINTEHSYPRSKGADSGNPRADMHHLYPTRVDVNGVRASFPFEEIPDSETATWYFDDIKTNIEPQDSEKDLYSEFRSGGFEVRESFKGNIARAVFYFYTIYRDEANAADSDFFPLQQEDLCDWHFADPVDQEEWDNTFKIAKYQSDIPNPFILDCRLARLYCPEIDMACGLVNSSDLDVSNVEIYPNPTNDLLYINSFNEEIKVELLNITGQPTGVNVLTNTLDLGSLNSGAYILKISSSKGVISKIVFKQ